jgi:hypothetical protein
MAYGGVVERVNHGHPCPAAPLSDSVGNRFEIDFASACENDLGVFRANSFATAAPIEPAAPKTTAFLPPKMRLFIMSTIYPKRPAWSDPCLLVPLSSAKMTAHRRQPSRQGLRDRALSGSATSPRCRSVRGPS